MTKMSIDAAKNSRVVADNDEIIDLNDGNCSDSDSIDTLELLKQSTELLSLNESLQPTTEVIMTTSNSVDSSQLVVPDAPSLSLNSVDKNEAVIEPSTIVEFKTNFSYGFDDSDEIKTDDLNHLEPKLRDAWIEMRRLDKVLQRVSDKEKRVKNETKSLLEKYREELELLKMTSDRKESKQEVDNTNNYLALSYFDTKEEEEDGLNDNQQDDPSSDRESMTPLFKTQPNGFELSGGGGQEDEEEENEKDDQNNLKKKKPSRNQSVMSSVSSVDIDNKNDKVGTSMSKPSKTSRTKSISGKTSVSNESSLKNGTKKNNKDFIKRNIQLAQDGAGSLAMTEDEKKRLDELLVDNDKDEKEFTFEYDKKTETHDQIVDYNPFEIKLQAGDGFTPNLSEQQRLNEIDNRLESRNYSRLLTGSRNAGVTSPASVYTNSNSLMQEVDPELYKNVLAVDLKKIKLNDNFDENEFGDKFIREARVSREQQNRLKYIDTQLDTMRSASEAGDDNSTQRTSSSNISLISQEQLQGLLDECSLSNKSVVSMIHNHKLGTLKEEDSNHIDDLSAIDEFITEETNDLEMNENIIRALVEQAKNEGIVPIQNDHEIETESKTGEPEPSFYEQAMLVLKEKPPILKDFNIELDIDYQLVEDDQVETIKLPKIVTLNDESGKSKIRRQTENANILSSRASSAASNIVGGDIDGNNNSSLRESITPSPAPSQSFLPKIDSRYLPNK